MKKFLTLYFFALLSVLIFFSSGVIDSQDGFQYLAVARNIYYTGKLTVQPEDSKANFNNIYMSVYKGKDGNIYGPTGTGFSLAYLPAVALTDLVYKVYDIKPDKYFPLESDWLIFLTAGFTNSFFGAGLGIILFLYFLEIGLNKKQALIMSVVGIFATNLLVYAKHSMAHMMFIFFLVLSFYLLKRYSKLKKTKLLIFSGTAFGVVMNTYNPTFMLPGIPYILYYLFLMKPKLAIGSLKRLSHDFLFVFLGALPFITFYLWIDNIKTLDPSYNQVSFYSNYIDLVLGHFAGTVIFEGIYGQLFSPGRSIFLYSPLLALIIIFWHKIRKNIRAEVIVFLSLLVIYIIFYAIQNVYTIKEGLVGFWHGESSWGPRYLTPLIPFGLLIVGSLYKNLSKRQEIFIFLPLAVISFLIQMVGVIVPYQNKFHNTEKHFYVNQTEYTNYMYVNLLPRYSPLITMPKELIKMAALFPKTLSHGIYNVRLYDGIDFPFNVGPERWRVIKGQGYISFDNNQENKISKLTFGFINHPISEASHSAIVKLTLNGQVLEKNQVTLAPHERKIVEIPLKGELLRDNNNQLEVAVIFDDESVLKDSTQILGMISFAVNDKPVNLESIDVPYISKLGPKIVGASYKNFGGLNNDPWLSWQIHTQIYERVPDFWWIKAIYYWDLPSNLFRFLTIANLAAILFFGYRLYTSKYWRR